MSKNVNVNGVDYSGVSQVQLKTADGGTALFKDVDEIVTPSGVKTITENGTYDVTNFATLVANIVASGGGVGLPIHTGTQTISNPNTKKYIEHNLNLNSYVCIYWLSNLDEYIAGTEETDCKVVCGVSCYKFDLGLPTDGNSFKNMVFAKCYKQSDKSWKASMNYDEAMPSIATDENKCFIATTSNLITGTYNWIIVDLSGLNIGGA
jgi:hypothetical protein